MKKLTYCGLALSALMACQSNAFAQIGVNVQFDKTDVNYGGRLRADINDPNYLYPTWSKGAVLQADGKAFKDLDLMFDQSKSRLIFRAPDGTSQAFAVPVNEFAISPPEDNSAAAIKKFQRGFEKFDGATPATYFEVLSDGKIKLLKWTQIKRVFERLDGDPISSKQIKPIGTYYVATGNTLTKLRREKKFIVNLLQDKADVADYIAGNKLSAQDEHDLKMIFDHYNSL
jgi:hypothetical protein